MTIKCWTLEMETGRQIGNKYQQWLTKTCPCCDREFHHLVEYEPVTCGDYDCLKIAQRHGLLGKLGIRKVSKKIGAAKKNEPKAS